MRVIVTGGTGLIGSKLAAGLASAGHQPIVLSRNPARYDFPASVEAAAWDAKTAAGWGHLVAEADAIVNLAGESIAGAGFLPQRWSSVRKQRILQSRLDAGKAVTEAIAQAARKPRLLLQASAVGYYGPRGSEILDEETTPGSDFLAEVCQQWEKATAVVGEMGVRRVVMRIGVVLSDREGALPLMALPFKLFAGGPLGNGRQQVSWIHIDDMVGAMLHLLQHERAQGVFNLVAPQPLPNSEFGRTIGRVLKRPYYFPVPAFAMKAALGEVSDIVLTGQRVDSQKLQESGYSFQFADAHAALSDLLQQ